MDAARDYIDAQGFRANVGIVILNGDRRVFLGGRARLRGWQFPQGGVRYGEPVLDALYRELSEEVGLSPAQVALLGQTRGWLRYRLPRQFVRRDSEPRCIGQKQRWFLLRLETSDSALRFDATDQPAEFDRWRWVDWWEAVREVIWFKRRVYARALHELGVHAFPEGLPPYPDWWSDRLQPDRSGAARS
ncbi:MAG: RNA pyrophosphohydrolase [Gammaproteobacteria bacterium]|nr:RNA pyrophosphohydrolase [Gammaproteobacteria bacterium]